MIGALVLAAPRPIQLIEDVSLPKSFKTPKTASEFPLCSRNKNVRVFLQENPS